MRLTEDTSIEHLKIGTHRRPHIVVGIPSFGMVPIEFLIAFGRLQMPVNGLSQIITTKGLEVGHARNYIVEQIMNMKERPPFMLFLGDDMLPPWDGVIRLYEKMEEEKWDVLTGLYYIKQEPPVPLTWRDDHVGRLLPKRDYELGECLWVDVTGLDFTMIRMSIFDEIEKPYFATGPTSVDQGVVVHTEDVWFLKKLKEKKKRVGVHTGVRVAHLDVKSGMIY